MRKDDCSEVKNFNLVMIVIKPVWKNSPSRLILFPYISHFT